MSCPERWSLKREPVPHIGWPTSMWEEHVRTSNILYVVFEKVREIKLCKYVEHRGFFNKPMFLSLRCVLRGTWVSWGKSRSNIVSGSFICQRLATYRSSLVTDVILDAVDVTKTIPLNNIHKPLHWDVSGHFNLLCHTGDLWYSPGQNLKCLLESKDAFFFSNNKTHTQNSLNF